MASHNDADPEGREESFPVRKDRYDFLPNELQKGPIKERQATDIGYSICFGCFWILLIVVTVFAWQNGTLANTKAYFYA